VRLASIISFTFVLLAGFAFCLDGFAFSKILVFIMAGLLFLGSLASYTDKRTGIINPWTIFALSFIQYYFLGPLDTFYFYDIMQLQTEVYGHLSPNDDLVMARTVATSLIGLAAALAGYFSYLSIAGSPYPRVKPIQWIFARQRMLAIISVTGAFGISMVIYFFYKVGFSNYISTERAMRYFLYGEVSGTGFLTDFVATAVVLASVYAIERYRGNPKWALFFIILLLIPFSYFNIGIFSGSRITVIRPVLIIGFYWMLRSGNTKVSFRTALVVVSLMIFAVLAGVYRIFMESDSTWQMVQDFSSHLSPQFVYNVFAQAFDYPATYDIFLLLNNKDYSLGMGDTYLKLLYQFIPRGIWPDKPENITIVMSKIFRPEQYEMGVSYNPTLLGEMYYNFSYAGVVAGCFLTGFGLGWLYKFGRRHINSPPMVFLYAVLIVSIIEQGRGAFSNITMSYLVFYVIPGVMAMRQITTREHATTMRPT